MKLQLFVVLLALLSQFTYAQSSIELSGVVDGDDPLASDVGDPWCDPDDRVEVRPFTVSVSGTYGFDTLSVEPTDARLFVQINENPQHEYEPLINIDTYGSSPVAAAPTGELVAGQQYYLAAITGCYDASENPVAFTVNLSGDGDIDIDAGGAPEPPSGPTSIPVNPIWMLIMLSGLAGLLGATYRRTVL